jgi:hypothetical protein
LLKLFLAGNLQEFWGMLRAIQTMILGTLIDINYPTLNLVFLQAFVDL